MKRFCSKERRTLSPVFSLALFAAAVLLLLRGAGSVASLSEAERPFRRRAGGPPARRCSAMPLKASIRPTSATCGITTDCRSMRNAISSITAASPPT